MRTPLLLSSIALLTAVGCSSNASDDPAGGSEDDVVTAQCPASFELDLAKPEIYTRTPTKYYDGSPLGESERGRVADAMKDARKFDAQKLSLSLDKKANARCTYVSSVSQAPTAPRAVLRGTAKKPLVDVTFGAYHYYAFPKAYAPEGLTFDSGARAGVFAQVAASGAFSDGASLIVKIGNATIASAAPPPSGDVGAAVAALESEDVLPGPGRDDDYHVTGATPLDMVKSYVAAKYADDPDLRDGYTYQENAAALSEDEQVAGTLTNEVAIAQALDSVKGWYSDEDDAASKAHLAKVKAALDAIVKAGGTFGFDGFEQNGCAAPTAFLLVLDAKSQMVYGVDLNPCQE